MISSRCFSSSYFSFSSSHLAIESRRDPKDVLGHQRTDAVPVDQHLTALDRVDQDSAALDARRRRLELRHSPSSRAYRGGEQNQKNRSPNALSFCNALTFDVH